MDVIVKSIIPKEANSMVELQPFFEVQERLLESVPLKSRRYLFDRIAWNLPLLGIVGARGCGKTTMLLQRVIEEGPDRVLYISADNPLVLKEGIYAIGDTFFKLGGELLVVDEVHRQSQWSNQIKGLADAFPGKRIFFSGSSKFVILLSTADLSRRVKFFELKHMSFREFLNWELETDLRSIEWPELISNHARITKDLKQIEPLKMFRNYLKRGSYPFGREEFYYDRLMNVIDKSIYSDIIEDGSLKGEAAMTMKKVIAFLATSKIPSISPEKISRELGITKPTLYNYLDSLERAGIIRRIPPCGSGFKGMRSGAKTFLAEPNLYYALAQSHWSREENMGTIREAFFASQVTNMPVCVPEKGDFLVRSSNIDVVVEIGGPSKGTSQIRETGTGVVMRDGIETGFGNIIPLYLAGFLY